MNYCIQVEGFEGQTIEVQPHKMFTGPKLLVNGQPASSGLKRNQMVLHRNDGKEIIASWKPRLLGLDVPKLDVDGKIINVVDPLKGYEWVWSGLPVLLIFSWGLIGGVVGFISFSINTKIFLSSLNNISKYFATAAVSVTAVIIYSVIVTLFLEAIGK
jgi:hypothetical protein